MVNDLYLNLSSIHVLKSPEKGSGNNKISVAWDFDLVMMEIGAV